MLGAAHILSTLASTNAKRKGRMVEQLMSEGDQILVELQAGPETPGGAAIPPITVTEMLSYGTGSTLLGSSEHILNPFGANLEGFHLFKGSMELAGYENGVDFTATFSDTIRKWVFDGPSAADGETLTYRFSYYRYREVAVPKVETHIRLVRV